MASADQWTALEPHGGRCRLFLLVVVSVGLTDCCSFISADCAGRAFGLCWRFCWSWVSFLCCWLNIAVWPILGALPSHGATVRRESLGHLLAYVRREKPRPSSLQKIFDGARKHGSPVRGRLFD